MLVSMKILLHVLFKERLSMIVEIWRESNFYSIFWGIEVVICDGSDFDVNGKQYYQLF